ncbi:type II secretion system protein [Proteiniborus sp. MB09-C3]|uniref:type II secretion system protein n=1 Tax=Proteiniborus sp. MB09-C3 TaxID=3050072 RepID=UPI002555EFC4|nr:type II secretion system protein [Proteiniborus sp. MB09-C3]WIV11020.1 type II secretion system protein [Proteiniborus sp. MB09-C3]
MFEFILKQLKQLKQNKKGFTLVELVVVIAILGILAAIAVPKLTTSRKAAADTAHQANIKVLTSAATMYIADEGVPTEADVVWTEANKDDDNGWGNYLQEWPKAPTGISNAEVNGKDYKVTISTGGDITVSNE